MAPFQVSGVIGCCGKRQSEATADLHRSPHKELACRFLLDDRGKVTISGDDLEHAPLFFQEAVGCVGPGGVLLNCAADLAEQSVAPAIRADGINQCGADAGQGNGIEKDSSALVHATCSCDVAACSWTTRWMVVRDTL